MTIDWETIKKNHSTAYFGEQYDKLLRQEAEVREMLGGDESLHDLAAKELTLILEQKEALEKQVGEILNKEKEAEDKLNESPNEIVLEVRI